MQLTPDRWRISVNDNGTLNHAYIGFARRSARDFIVHAAMVMGEVTD
jgi:hypothetical protein